jgi:general secretion pathway protein L
MTAALIMMLPDDGPIRQWWRVEHGAVVDSGHMQEWPKVATGAEDEMPVIALAPAASVPVRWHHLPELTPPQAAAAARLNMMDAVLGTVEQRHVVAGAPGDDAMVPVAVVAHDAMRRWLALLDEAAIAPRALVPVTALVPMPEEDRVLRAEIGGTMLLRTADLCAEADAALDPLRIGTAPVDGTAPGTVAGWLGA